MIRAIALIGALTLTGCSLLTPGHSEYGCPYTQGVKCESAREVYEDTNPGAHPQTKKKDVKSETRAAALTPDQLPQQADRWPLEPWMNLPRLDAPQPLRTPPVVMRVWVASWQDVRGDLQMPGFTYTEIEPRRWAVGEESDKGAQRLVPLDVKSVPVVPQQAAGASSSPSTSR